LYWRSKANTDKTKVIVFSRGRQSTNLTLTLNGSELEIVNEFNYLGILFNRTGNFNNKAMKKQAEKATKAMFEVLKRGRTHNLLMGFTYDFYANRWRMCSISYYFRNSSASINNVTNVNYDIDLQKMYMYSCKMPQILCLKR
jgi:hypothetical protein